MVVYFLEDHQFPLVDVNALVRVGSIYEPAEKVGLASVTGEVMRTGGSMKTPGDALDEKLEAMGASVEISIGETQGSATVSTLAEDIDQGIQVLGEVLRTPAFPEEKIGLAKKQEKTAIASRNDEHLNIALRELGKLIYGPQHPYARTTEYATIDAISRDDLVAFHQTYFHPDRIIMTVYGDFNRKKVQSRLEKTFGDWAKGTAPLPPDPPVDPAKDTATYLADKEGLTNSIIFIGQEGMRQDDPDYPAMSVFHEMVGGGFSSRLMNEIRSRRGLAYATGSFGGAGLHHPGPAGFYVVTQADSTLATLGHLRREIERAQKEPFTDEEIRRAKDSILNSLVFSLSSKGAVLNRMASYEYYGYPRDFLTRYQEAVKQVTAQDVAAAAGRKVRYPNMGTLIVGEKSRFESALAGLGTYNALDISIPEPAGAAVPQGSEADFQRGAELLAAAAKAAGGDALAGIHTLVVEESGTFSVQGMQLQVSSISTRKLPDCERSEQKLPMGTMIQVLCGESGWMDMMRGPQDLPPEAKEEAVKERTRDLLNVLRNPATLRAQALPEEATVDGRPAVVAFIHDEAVKEWKVYFDKETGRIVRMDFRDRSMTGSPVLSQVLYKDFKEVQGITWPHRREISQDGEPLAALEVTAVRVNPDVSEALFKKP
jgi:predicted Zn-dependent peptidase